MQAQLSRQLRADKRAEAEREERESRRQARRDEEMRELAIKLRRKQREMRHRYRRSSDEESDRSRSRSSSIDSAGDKKPSRSKSRSPHEKRPPVWEKNAAPYKSSDPPLPPLPPLNTPPPPFRKRNPDEEFNPYYPKKDNRSSSPSKRIPVWETQREPYRLEAPDSRRPRYQEDRPEYDNFRRYDNHFDPNMGPYDNRWDSRRRPYGNRGAYRGYRPLPPGVGPNWQKDHYDENEDNDRSKVKLVDY